MKEAHRREFPRFAQSELGVGTSKGSVETTALSGSGFYPSSLWRSKGWREGCPSHTPGELRLATLPQRGVI